MKRWIGALVALLLAAGCSVTPTAAAPQTQVIDVKLLDDAGRVSSEWMVVGGQASPILGEDCTSGTPSPVARGANIQTCFPLADAAQICWAPPGQNNVYCGDDPWSRTVRKLYASNRLTPVPAPIDPIPWGVQLADGSHCTLWTGGAISTGVRDWHVAYSCDGNLYVLASDNPTIDKSAAVWTVMVGEIDTGGTAPAAPVRQAVQSAYFAA